MNSLVLSLLYGPTLTSVHDCWKNLWSERPRELHLVRCLCCCCCCLVAQLCLVLCNPMDYSSSGSSVHGILQAVVEWFGMSFSKGCSQPRGGTQVSCIDRQILYTEPPEKRQMLLDCCFFLIFLNRVMHRVRSIPSHNLRQGLLCLETLGHIYTETHVGRYTFLVNQDPDIAPGRYIQVLGQRILDSSPSGRSLGHIYPVSFTQ